MPVIVDGYNLLRARQKAHEQFESVSDVQLCRILGRYLKSVGEKGEIIFDGIGPPDKTGFDNISNLEVFFVGFNTDADSVIEDKIKAKALESEKVIAALGGKTPKKVIVIKSRLVNIVI